MERLQIGRFATVFVCGSMIAGAAFAADPAPQAAPTRTWEWSGCKKTVETALVIRCPSLTMRVGQVAQKAAATDADLEKAEREALAKSAESFSGKFPGVKGTVAQLILDLGGGKKTPRSVLSFPETKETNAVAFHALAIPGSAGGQHTVVVYACTAKRSADCDAALVDVVTKGPPKI